VSYSFTITQQQQNQQQREKQLTEPVGATDVSTSSTSSIRAAVGERVGAVVWTFEICKSSTTISLQK
jgi:hypothetical protein